MSLGTTAKVVTAFKIVAVVEALTWVALLIGMYFKWVEGHASAVQAPGMTHGIVFIVLVVLTLAVARLQRWNLVTVGLALAATVLPFCSVVFEVWAARTGRLDPVGAPRSPGREPASVR
ncbi:DUF3817 domain-containing protein [Tsukamurella soli]|uniref:DUF3817 domain-containing protein n=1 Tax=Tsukamurella soli TaxID=644556 RepID=A0ABP8J9V5_9ACTN